jgi:hypothetical protein
MNKKIIAVVLRVQAKAQTQADVDFLVQEVDRLTMALKAVSDSAAKALDFGAKAEEVGAELPLKATAKVWP